MANDNEKKLDLSHLILAGIGALVGSWWVNNQVEESKKSRAEKEYPEEVEEVCKEIWDLINDWRPRDCESESDYSDDLYSYLDYFSQWEVECYPHTNEGKPDILIEDLLALELKINPSKSERDRLVGQCAGYSREWVTWAIIIDAGASKIGKIEKLLVDKGLEKILVISFN